MAGGMRAAWISAALTAGLLMGATESGAQILNDPTRPPAGINAADAADGAAARGPVLQSVKISPTERSAIIGGEVVKLGAKYGEARVIRITENEVVLRSASGTEILRMYPGVEIKPVVPAAPKTGAGAEKNRRPATHIPGKQG
jgi:MSHA biogenesis protein MshK